MVAKLDLIKVARITLIFKAGITGQPREKLGQR
jgi:hypothetical protein